MDYLELLDFASYICPNCGETMTIDIGRKAYICFDNCGYELPIPEAYFAIRLENGDIYKKNGLRWLVNPWEKCDLEFLSQIEEEGYKIKSLELVEYYN